MDIKTIAKGIAITPIFAYYTINEFLLTRLAKKAIKKLDFDYALNYQNNFLNNLSLDIYPQLKHGEEHEELLKNLRSNELKNELVNYSRDTLLIRSHTSQNLEAGISYHSEIQTLWDKKTDTPKRIFLYSAIDNYLESGLSFVLLPFPPNQKDLDKIIGYGATYHSLSKRIMHERQVGFKSAQDQYFLLNPLDQSLEAMTGCFGSKIDTNPEYRGMFSAIFKT